MHSPRVPGALLIVAVVLGACASGGSGTSASSDPTDEPSASPSLSLASDQPQPSGSPAQGGDRVTGALGADSIEGGCGYLQAADGTRYQVQYPDGWELSLSPLELRDPDGTVVASGGDEVTVTGEVATDMASICQIGPIFRAVTVEP